MTHTAKHICNSHKPSHKPKIAKELVLSATAEFADSKKQNLLKTENGMPELKNYLKPLNDKNAQLVTIKHRFPA